MIHDVQLIRLKRVKVKGKYENTDVTCRIEYVTLLTANDVTHISRSLPKDRLSERVGCEMRGEK